MRLTGGQSRSFRKIERRETAQGKLAGQREHQIFALSRRSKVIRLAGMGDNDGESTKHAVVMNGIVRAGAGGAAWSMSS
jgi:hypothetical protein